METEDSLLSTEQPDACPVNIQMNPCHSHPISLGAILILSSHVKHLLL
jgi:hypothetical protein